MNCEFSLPHLIQSTFDLSFSSPPHIDHPAHCLQPPIVPRLSHPGDTRNFERYPEDGWFNVAPLSDQEIQAFKDF